MSLWHSTAPCKNPTQFMLAVCFLRISVLNCTMQCEHAQSYQLPHVYSWCHPHAHLPAAGCHHSSQPSCMACSGSAGVNPSTLGWLALSWGQEQPLACIQSVSGGEKIHLAIHWEDVSWPMKESRMQVGCNSLRNNKSKGQRNNKSKDKGSTSDNAVSLVQEDWGFLSKLG